ncbi:methylglyoxal reductase (NADPH-dependent) gre2 [Neonectria punicea]|uniref:Methylglyoxal reductase (NADPH-dependent) gre2 n=1 Tax=Neonectria punicea TaxID=979145 RepID=A0ABR1HDD7_9HYPO
MTRVLLTGGSGFVAGHVIDVLLKRGHSVITTVRSQEKAEAIRTRHQDVPQSNLDFVVVPDISANGAFGGLGSYGLQAVIHVASPFHYNVTDPKKDLIDPAVLGTTNILKAVMESCPTVKRVVITSSFAAILDPHMASTGAKKTYTEADWSPVTLEDAYKNGLNAYIASKVLAEKAAWEFVATEKPNFTICTINPPMVYGPVNCPVKPPRPVNTSNKLLVDVLAGKHKAGLPPTALPLWADVRDVALAHVKAMEVDEAAGNRFLVTAGSYSNADMGNIIWNNFPDLRDKLPDRNKMGGAPNPNLQSFGYNTSQAKKILGIEWTPYEKTIVDSVKSFST